MPELDDITLQIVTDYVNAINKPLHDGKVALDRIDEHKNCDAI